MTSVIPANTGFQSMMNAMTDPKMPMPNRLPQSDTLCRFNSIAYPIATLARKRIPNPM